MRFHELLLESTPRTLYHGTLRRFLPNILKYGLLPSVGEFTRRAYDEAEAAGIELPDLVFAADKEGLGKCVGAILGALDQVSIDDTAANLIKYGAIVVLKFGEDDFSYRPEDEEREDYPETVEPGDYFREMSIKPDFAIVGDKLRSFLLRNNVELHYGLRFERKYEVNRLIRLLKRVHPDITSQDIREKVLTLADKEVSKWVDVYEKKVRQRAGDNYY